MEYGQRVGDYEVLDQLGRGGMGGVYRARNVLSNRTEAMKVLLPGLVDSPELAERFLREIRVLAALDHPNIAALRTALTSGDQVVMVMELVEGEPLSRRVKRGPVPIADAVSYATQALSALAYAHGQGVIHRDVKPANMMLTPEGTVKLTDFGIARSVNDRALTSTGSTTGSLAYMSPEQVAGAVLDARSDLYSAGISLYEMVTGRTPFQGQSEFMLMAAHVNETPAAPSTLRADVPVPLDAIILRAIAKAPLAVPRPQSTLISAPLASRPAVHAPPAPAATRRPHAVPPVVYVAIGAVLVVAAAAGTGSFLRRAEAETGGTRDAQSQSPGQAGSSEPVSDAAPAASEPVPTVLTLPVPSRDPASAAPPQERSGAPAAAPLTGTGPAAPSPGANRAAVDAGPGGGAAASAQTGPATPPASTQSAAPAARPAADAVPPDVVAAVRARVESDLDRVSIRAGAVNDSVDRLRDEQARQGLGLRGDIVARQRSLSLNLSRAEEALNRGDVAAAERYSAAAQSDADALEKFLGR
jgi:serine/threonine-protein kinase